MQGCYSYLITSIPDPCPNTRPVSLKSAGTLGFGIGRGRSGLLQGSASRQTKLLDGPDHEIHFETYLLKCIRQASKHHVNEILHSLITVVTDHRLVYFRKKVFN